MLGYFLENRRCGLLPDIQYSFREFYEYSYLQMMENDGVTGRLPPKVYDELAKYHCTKQSVWV